MAATSIVYAAVMLRVDFDAGQIVIKGDIVRLICILTVARVMRSALDTVTLTEPEFSRFEYIELLVLLRCWLRLL